jgi:hypothetical protein
MIFFDYLILRTDMMKKTFLISLFLFLLTGASLWAAFKIGPSYFEISLAPGESVTKEIYLENPSGKAMTLVVNMNDFMNSKANKNVGNDQWLTLKEKEVTIPRKSKKLLKLQITAPKGMTGEVSAKIGFMEKPTAESTVHTRMLVFVYLISLNGSTIGAEMNSFDAVWNKDKSLGFKIGIKNSGNIHIRPKGSLEVYDAANKIIKVLKLPEIMPLFEDQEGFLMNEESIKSIPDGTYPMKLSITFGYDKKYDINSDFSMKISEGKAKIELVK